MEEKALQKFDNMVSNFPGAEECRWLQVLIRGDNAGIGGDQYEIVEPIAEIVGSFHNWSSDNQIIFDGKELEGKTSQLSYQNTKIDQDEFSYLVACVQHGSVFKIKMMRLAVWDSNESSVFSLRKPVKNVLADFAR